MNFCSQLCYVSDFIRKDFQIQRRTMELGSWRSQREPGSKGRAKLGAREAHLPFWRGTCCGFPAEPVVLAQNQVEVLVISNLDLHPWSLWLGDA